MMMSESMAGLCVLGGIIALFLCLIYIETIIKWLLYAIGCIIGSLCSLAFYVGLLFSFGSIVDLLNGKQYAQTDVLILFGTFVAFLLTWGMSKLMGVDFFDSGDGSSCNTCSSSDTNRTTNTEFNNNCCSGNQFANSSNSSTGTDASFEKRKAELQQIAHDAGVWHQEQQMKQQEQMIKQRFNQ